MLNPKEPQLLQPKFELVSYTTPAPELIANGITTSLDLIAYCARVSNPDNQFNTATAEKLIRFLINRAEWSPLEMVDVTFGITTARDISRQILRHRSASFQEYSQRYAEVGQTQHCLREARLQHPTDRQSSIECTDAEDIQWWHEAQLGLIEHAQSTYREALRRGFAKEVARVVLPEGLTLTSMYMKASVRTWIHYLALRSGNGTQKEHQQIAQGLAAVISWMFPVDSILKEKAS